MNRRGNGTSISSSSSEQRGTRSNEKIDEPVTELPNEGEMELHRGLKARHITMIAIGGAIGTGLIIGT